MDRDRLPTSRESRTSNGGLGLVFAGALAGIVVTVFAVVFLVDSLSWDWQRLTGSDSPNLIEAWRNIGLIALGAVGIGLATWRSMIAHRQTRTAVEQRRISERGLNVDRYQKGAAMLESEELPVRIAGIYGLRELAMSDPEESYILVQSVLFAFIRETSKKRALKAPDTAVSGKSQFATTEVRQINEGIGVDIEEALDATKSLRRIVKTASALEAAAAWRPNLKNSVFSGLDLARVDLRGADLQNANFKGTRLFCSDLSNTRLKDADLTGAELLDANLSGAILAEVNFSQASLRRSNISAAELVSNNISDANLYNLIFDNQTLLIGVWAWADRPPKNIPQEIADQVIYCDPAMRKEGE
ncbi:pentapeptide repeat-containing protein [Stappia sp.]|uniref:pentapeptide repeat-containing protein n=1 Tax=Stappia sp. TaxID=1870903 RepID=UPI0032D90D19